MPCHESESRYCNEIRKAETPLCMLSEKADSPCSDRMARDRSLGHVLLRYESTNRGQKFSKSKNFSTFFQNRFSSCFRTMRQVLAKKFFPTYECLVTSQSPGIAMRFQRRKLPFACYQRRRTLPVRIAWQGAGAWVSHCDTRVAIEAKNFQCRKFLENRKIKLYL